MNIRRGYNDGNKGQYFNKVYILIQITCTYNNMSIKLRNFFLNLKYTNIKCVTVADDKIIEKK